MPAAPRRYARFCRRLRWAIFVVNSLFTAQLFIASLLLVPRQADLPRYAGWTPHFFDYIFLACNTSVAFSPTETAPLSRATKIMTMTQSAISLIAFVVVAGTVINILAGNA